MAVELRRATEFSRHDLASIFTASYRDYFVPFKVDEETFDYMVDAFDLVLAHSLVAVEAGAAVGLANLGRRGERTWVRGVGVIPARRGGGGVGVTWRGAGRGGSRGVGPSPRARAPRCAEASPRGGPGAQERGGERPLREGRPLVAERPLRAPQGRAFESTPSFWLTPFL